MIVTRDREQQFFSVGEKVLGIKPDEDKMDWSYSTTKDSQPSMEAGGILDLKQLGKVMSLAPSVQIVNK